MKKNQTQIKKYAAVISIFLAAVIVGLFVFFFCIKRSVEQRSKNTMRNNVVRQSEHLRTILDIQYDYLNALAEEIGKTDHLLAKKNMDLIKSITKHTDFGADAGAELTISGFTSTYGNWISIFTAVALCCFAFSTIIGWGLYGARCIEFLFSSKVIKPFMLVYSLVAILGATVDLGMLWSIAETFNGLMAIPNLIALFLLSGTVVKLVKDYFHEK